MAQYGQSGDNLGDVQGPFAGQTAVEGNPRPDRPDMDLREIGSDFATHPLRAQVLDEDAAEIATGPGQPQKPTGEVIVLDAADVTPFVGEGFGDGSVHGHALLARVQRSAAKGTVKAARSNEKMSGVGLHEADTVAEVSFGVRTRKPVTGRSDTRWQAGGKDAQRVDGEVDGQNAGVHLSHEHGEPAVATTDFQHPATTWLQCMEMLGNFEEITQQ